MSWRLTFIQSAGEAGWALPACPALARRGAAGAEARRPLRPTALGPRFPLLRRLVAVYPHKFRDCGTMSESQDAVFRHHGAHSDIEILNVSSMDERECQERPTRIRRFMPAIGRVEEGLGGAKPEPLPPFPSLLMKPDANFSNRDFRPASAQS